MMQTVQSEQHPIVVCALYHFAKFSNFEDFQNPLLELMDKHGVRGTLLLAREGINGTIAGDRDGIDAILEFIRSDDRFTHLVHKESYEEAIPFLRAKVKLKKEIVTMGVEDIDPNHIVGTYVKPKDWNDLISDPDVILIDTRNQYEVEIGTFKNAVDPHTTTFREFPAYAEENLDPAKHKKVAMFCTGGIRCEKSTAYLKQQGFEEVYHLEGGILKYLEQVPEEESMWEGECFVFDNRVSVNHQLEKGIYDQCHACRMPITEEDKKHEYYRPGVSCHHCNDQTTEKQRKRFAEREKQMQLAKARGEDHMGSNSTQIRKKRKRNKLEQKEAQRKV